MECVVISKEIWELIIEQIELFNNKILCLERHISNYMGEKITNDVENRKVTRNQSQYNMEERMCRMWQFGEDNRKLRPRDMKDTPEWKDNIALDSPVRY